MNKQPKKSIAAKKNSTASTKKTAIRPNKQVTWADLIGSANYHGPAKKIEELSIDTLIKKKK